MLKKAALLFALITLSIALTSGISFAKTQHHMRHCLSINEIKMSKS